MQSISSSNSYLKNVLEILPIRFSNKPYELPLYVSKVQAGFPSPADDYIEKRLSPNSFLVKNESSSYFLKVIGDSMIDAGIFNSDVLIIDRSIKPSIGDIVVAVIDGEFTVKTLGKKQDGFVLIPANKNYPVIHIKSEQTFEIWGVVTGSMRKFK